MTPSSKRVTAAAARRLLFTLIIMVAPLTAIRAQASSDSTIVIERATALISAISARDTGSARQLLLPAAQFVSIADPAKPTATARVQSDSAFYATLPLGKQKLLERIWTPAAQMFGTLAIVSAPYDFHIDGKFSHCGTDVMLLVKSQGIWRISSVTYTTQVVGCLPSPLGAPASSP
jgi:hypothetical protein